jgi:hypothetical protein
MQNRREGWGGGGGGPNMLKNWKIIAPAKVVNECSLTQSTDPNFSNEPYPSLKQTPETNKNTPTTKKRRRPKLSPVVINVPRQHHDVEAVAMSSDGSVGGCGPYVAGGLRGNE